MKNTQFKIQYFNGKTATWKPTGLPTFTTQDEAKKGLAAQVKMTGGAVRFRILQVQEVA